MWKNQYYLNNNNLKITDRQSKKKRALALLFLMTMILWGKNHPTIIAPSTVTMQKLERQGMQKSKKPGVDKERTQVWGESHCGGGNLDQDQGTTFPGRGDGYRNGHGFGDGYHEYGGEPGGGHFGGSPDY